MIKTKKRELKFYTTYLWIKNLQQEISPIDHLRDQGIDSIIIYGVAELGELLVKEAIKKEFHVAAITDKKILQGNCYYDDIPIIPVKDLLMDQYQHIYVVITSMNFVEEIEKELSAIGIERVISLIDLL